MATPPTITRAAAAAAEGRESFVDYVLNDFVEVTSMAVSDEVRGFILNDVLSSDHNWAAGLKDHRFDPDRIAEILTEALKEASHGPEAFSSGELGIESVGTAKVGPFYFVIHDRWHCPFPLIFC